jgi:outer membrane protein OmpA-like peptidoglycan-associated protein
MSQKSRIRFLGLSALASVVLSSFAPINVGGVSADYPPTPTPTPAAANGTPVTPPSGSGLLINEAGVAVPVPVALVGDKVQVGTSNFNMALTPQAGTATYENNNITMTSTSTVAVTGVGFQPGSTVEVWLFSTPRLLGTAIVKADGTFRLDVSVPAEVEGGKHTLQAEGLNTAGQARAISTPVVVKTAVSSAQVNFDSNSSRLTPASQASLRAYAMKVKASKFTNLFVTGYTDALGTSAFNINLSRARADAVAAYLKMKLKGSSVKVNVSYKGKTSPIGANSTDKGRATNRRVELFAS